MPARFHHHKRQRKEKGETLVPNKRVATWKNLLDKMMYPVGLIGPITTIPQIVAIYSTQDASSVAVSTWISFFILAIPWIMYGIIHKEKIIIFSQAARVVSYILIIIGVFLYS